MNNNLSEKKVKSFVQSDGRTNKEGEKTRMTIGRSLIQLFIR